MASQAGHIDCDLAVFWSHKLDVVIKRQQRSGRDYLVLEGGYVGTTAPPGEDYIAARTRFVSMGYNGLNGRAEFHNMDVPGDRWEKYFADKLQPWQREGELIVLLGQVRTDQSVKGIDLIGKYREWAHLARIRFRQEVVLRPHPLDPSLVVPGVRTLEATLSETLAQAKFVVTFNSNSAVDAILAGVPAVVFDRGSMAYAVAGHNLYARPPMLWRQRWAERLAYTQWTKAEIENGDAWEHLKQRYTNGHTGTDDTSDNAAALTDRDQASLTTI